MDEAIQDEVAQTIDRCAAVVQDLDALRDALHELRLSSDPRAQFATALFDLDRARRGDAEARTTMLQVADALLVFWREGTGEELAREHPELVRLWTEASALLVTFEQKRLSKLLKACWDAREDAALLQVAVADLQPDDYRRVEFARCLYHLELARQFVQESRAEFSKRAGLLTEAYQDPEVAKDLIGGDAGLQHLWDELVPYLDEFFEHQERQAYLAKTNKVTGKLPAVPSSMVKTDPLAQPADTTPPATPSVPLPAAEPVAATHGVPLANSHQVPSFRTLVGGRLPPPPMTPPGGPPPFESSPSASSVPTQQVPALERTPPGAPPPVLELAAPTPREPTPQLPAPEDASASPPVLELGAPTPREPSPQLPARESAVVTPREPTPALAPPPPPTDFTPPGGWKPPAEDEGDVLLDAELDAPPPPPPPRDLTPPGAWFPPGTTSGEVELVDFDEVELAPAPPPPPALTPARGLPSADVDLDVAEEEPEVEPDLATLDFWAHTFETLQMNPGADGRAAQRLFATETRADRKRLVEYLDSLEPHLQVPEARAFGCLVRLMLASQTKEKGLFGQANPVRQEAVQAALSLLSASPTAAGHAAVWFELDGMETRATLWKGLEVLVKYLAFCSRGQVDPLNPAAAKRFATGG